MFLVNRMPALLSYRCFFRFTSYMTVYHILKLFLQKTTSVGTYVLKRKEEKLKERRKSQYQQNHRNNNAWATKLAWFFFHLAFIQRTHTLTNSQTDLLHFISAGEPIKFRNRITLGKTIFFFFVKTYERSFVKRNTYIRTIITVVKHIRSWKPLNFKRKAASIKMHRIKWNKSAMYE